MIPQNTNGHVAHQRYPEGFASGNKLTEPLNLLPKTQVVPVVGLEPTRRFKVPGF